MEVLLLIYNINKQYSGIFKRRRLSPERVNTSTSRCGSVVPSRAAEFRLLSLSFAAWSTVIIMAIDKRWDSCMVTSPSTSQFLTIENQLKSRISLGVKRSRRFSCCTVPLSILILILRISWYSKALITRMSHYPVLRWVKSANLGLKTIENSWMESLYLRGALWNENLWWK